jgi:hypothetical protein
MSDGETETLLGHDPGYFEKFVGADDVDGFEDYEVESDVFHGVCCPPAPISSRISYRTHNPIGKFCAPQASAWPCVWGPWSGQIPLRCVCRSAVC